MNLSTEIFNLIKLINNSPLNYEYVEECGKILVHCNHYNLAIRLFPEFTPEQNSSLMNKLTKTINEWIRDVNNGRSRNS